MPELPEVEHLRRTLEPIVCGARVLRVHLHRPDIALRLAADGGSGRGRGQHRSRELLAGTTIARVHRHGKQLALEAAEDGSVLCVHLGMTGRMIFTQRGRRPDKADHIHCTWQIDSPSAGPGRLIFRDPRRFGGIWTAGSMNELHAARWHRLGPDALTITPRVLAAQLQRTRSPIKAALLNQHIIAGVGNIYADESLHRAKIHPSMAANQLDRAAVLRLQRAIRGILTRAINAGGSTLRDYVDAAGEVGWFVRQLTVYGRAGEPCGTCGETLIGTVLAQRATVYCPMCQPCA